MKISFPRKLSKNDTLLIIGSATIETNVAGGRTFQRIGGVPTYAGFTFSKHGMKAAVLTNIARADLHFFHSYARFGIQTITGTTVRTTRFISVEDSGNRLQKMPAAADPIRLWIP